MSAIKGYKTVAFNIIMGVLLAIQMIGGSGDDMGDTGGMVNTLLDNIEQIIMVAGNIWLRFSTTTPFGKATA